MKKILTAAAAALVSIAALSVCAFAESLPAKYDARDVKGLLPPIRNQQSTPLCWSFGMNTNVEIALRKNKVYDEGNKFFDLSEMHPAIIQSEEYLDDVFSPYTFSYTTYEGAYSINELTYLMCGRGFVRENDLPFQEGVSGFYLNDTYIKDAGICVNGVSVCSPCYASTGFGNTYKENMVKTKRDIMQYGSVESGIYHASEALGSDGKSYFSIAEQPVNHAVVYVGWDDNYPAESFDGADGSPKNDGAWIVRNSWDSNWGDDGYYYVSYECTNTVADAGYYTVTNVGKRDYDTLYLSNRYFPVSNTGFTDNGDSEYAAAVFDKTANEQSVSAVTVYAEKGDVYEVYLCDNYKSKSSLKNRTLIASGTAKYSGCFTADVKDRAITGERFAVIVKYTNDNREFLVPICTDLDSVHDFVPSDFSPEKKRTFISSKGTTWEDLATDKFDSSQFAVNVRTVNTSKCYNVLFDITPYYGFVTVYDKNGTEQHKNNDGTYTLQNGTYYYDVNIDGAVCDKEKFTVNGKDLTVARTFNIKPSASFISDECVGIKDKRSEVVLSIDYGCGDYASTAVTEVFLNGKGIDYIDNGGYTISLKHSDFESLTSGTTAKVFLKFDSNCSDTVKIPIKKYSELGLFLAAEEAAVKAVENCKLSWNSTFEDIAIAAQSALRKYSDDFSVYIDEYSEEIASTVYENGLLSGSIEVSNNNNYYDLISFSRVLPLPETGSASDGKHYGWEKLSAYAAKLSDGKKLNIDVNEDYLVPKEFWQAIKGKDIKVTLDCGGYEYSFSGNDVSDAFDCSIDIFNTADYTRIVNYYEHLDYESSYTLNAARKFPMTAKLSFMAQLFMEDDEYYYYTYIARTDKNANVEYSDTMLLGPSVTEINIDFAGNGFYTITLLTAVGDLDNTEVCDKKDLKILRSYLDREITMSDKQYYGSDFDCDGVLTENDYKLMKKYIETGKIA